MKISVKVGEAYTVKTDGLAVGVFENELGTPLLKKLNRTLDNILTRASKAKRFVGKKGETLACDTLGSLPAQKVFFVGLGKKEEVTEEIFRQAAAKCQLVFNGSKVIKNFASALTLLKAKGVSAEKIAQAVAEGTILASYTFDQFKSEKSKSVLKQTILLVKNSEAKARAAAKKGSILAESALFSRDLINLPGNHATPTYLADQAKKIGRAHGVKVKVLGPAEIKKLKMGGLMAVSQGSAEPARFIIMEWMKGPKSQKPIVLVGKGITFDTGGISIKPSASMEEMKTDMSGAAGVMGAMKAAAQLNLKVNLVALIPTAENMPSGTAIKPGDVATAMSGVTMEIINTDAEGRLILADGLAYAKRYKPDCVVDIATLTGACMIALGQFSAGLFGDNDELIAQLKESGDITGERMWPLPLWPEYEEQIKSDVADIKNVGPRWGGAITAAAFLKRHVEGPWAHIDIAGVALNNNARHYLSKGGVGFGVRSLIHFVEERGK